MYWKHPILTSLLSKYPTFILLSVSDRIISSKRPPFMIFKRLIMKMISLRIQFSTFHSISQLEISIKPIKASKIFKIQLFGKKWPSCVWSPNVWMLLKYVLAIWSLPEELEVFERPKKNLKFKHNLQWWLFNSIWLMKLKIFIKIAIAMIFTVKCVKVTQKLKKQLKFQKSMIGSISKILTITPLNSIKLPIISI